MNLFNKIFITLFVAMCTTSPVWAAADMYLKIDGVKGESKIVSCPGGTCVLEGLTAGDYELHPCDQTGNPLATQVVLYEVPAMQTREAGSGMATGKRQHKPVRMISQTGEAMRRFGLQISNDVPVTIQIKNISAIKTDSIKQNDNINKNDRINQNDSRTNRLPQ